MIDGDATRYEGLNESEGDSRYVARARAVFRRLKALEETPPFPHLPRQSGGNPATGSTFF